jgi:hypothetical protein
METLTRYQQIAEEVVTHFYRLIQSVKEPGVEDQLVIDHLHGHYFILNVGWKDLKHIYASPLHLDVKDDKIWIQQDLIDVRGGIATELLDRGVPKEDIVLAFHAPYKRPYTGFAVA